MALCETDRTASVRREIDVSSPSETSSSSQTAVDLDPVFTMHRGGKTLVDEYTWRSNLVAVVTDGTAVLGLGNLGPAAALPVM